MKSFWRDEDLVRLMFSASCGNPFAVVWDDVVFKSSLRREDWDGEVIFKVENEEGIATASVDEAKIHKIFTELTERYIQDRSSLISGKVCYQVPQAPFQDVMYVKKGEGRALLYDSNRKFIAFVPPSTAGLMIMQCGLKAFQESP